MASTSGEELFFKEFEYFLRECMRDNTEVFTIVRGDTTQKAEGVREIDQREYIAFHHAADVRPGDCLRGGVLGEELWLVEVAPVMLAGHLVQTKAYYQTAAEREERLAKSATPPTALRTASVAHARFAPPRAAPVAVVDFHALEKHLGDRAGPDSKDLQELLGAVRELLEHRKRIDRGALARFSTLMERHTWLATPLAQALLEWALSGGGRRQRSRRPAA